MLMPLTRQAHQASMEEPGMAGLLPIRDFLDKVMVRIDGCFVAGYRVGGLNTYFADNGKRNLRKANMEFLLRALPERSMRLQVRCEVTQEVGDLLTRFDQAKQNPLPALTSLERLRRALWEQRERAGYYLNHVITAYFIWDPRIHQELTAEGVNATALMRAAGFSPSIRKCIQRSRAEHEQLLGAFESLLTGVETSLYATGMELERMTDQELFLEVKKALNPKISDRRPYVRSEIGYHSAREQAANVNLEEAETYLNIDGLLYGVLTVKDLPDSTAPGLMRALSVLDYPLVISAEVVIDEQTQVVAQYNSRLKKMQAAQISASGGHKIDVSASVAQRELRDVLDNIQSSSLKTCKWSMTLVTRTSTPAWSHEEIEKARILINERLQQLRYAVARLNGARAIAETWAKQRLWIGSLPGLADENQRDLECLTPNAADLLPLETPWGGTPEALMLFETPYRQLISFSPWGTGLANANLLIMGKSGGGKTFLTQQMLLMAARARPKVSILEKGDSYQALVELMGGRIVDVDLDGRETLNPWDLPPGQTEPSNDKIAFLKQLVLFMIGAGEDDQKDQILLEGLISDAIAATYRRVGMRESNPTPRMSDLAAELAQWQDEDGLDDVRAEARLTAAKLRPWVGDRGIYARLFDRHTNMDLSSDWIYFNIEKLADDPRLQTAMSFSIAHDTAERFSGQDGRPAIMILDECWFLLDSPILAPQVEQLFRTSRKRGGSVWAISQAPEDFVGTSDNPRPQGPAIIKTTDTKIIGQQPGETHALRDHLRLTDVAIEQIKTFSSPRKGHGGDVLIAIGEDADTTHTIRVVPTPVDYWVCTTDKRETVYRRWFLQQHADRPLIESYGLLGEKFPNGLSTLEPLEEECSGEVLRLIKTERTQ